MSEEGTSTGFLRTIISKAETYIPQVPKPKKKIPLHIRLIWCGVALFIYMIMGQTPLYGASTPAFDFLAFARVIFASQQGTLVELGIGPIVTAGLLMQLLKGSEIFPLDFKKPEDRELYQTAPKIVTYIVIIAESSLYGRAVYGPRLPKQEAAGSLIGQLMGAWVIIMVRDELVQKGWGIGSGISLCIAAGVAQQVVWALISPIPAGDGGPVGVMANII